MQTRTSLKTTLFSFILLVLVACGGGGGEGDSSNSSSSGDSSSNSSSSSSSGASSSSTSSSSSGGSNVTGWLYTQGNKIYRADGSVFMGRGANIFDTRACNNLAYNPPNVAEINRRTDELVDVWGANFMRLALESYASLDGRTHGLSVLHDPDYLDDIVEIVEHIGTKPGAIVLVSNWIEPSTDDMGWPTAGTVDVWRALVPRLAQYPHVMFGIVNEPEFNNDGALDSQVWDRMAMVVEAIREVEIAAGSPEHIITVQGTRGWARSTEYYINHPITIDGVIATNIAYETHVYNPQTDFNELVYTPSQTLPLIIGEFGPAYMTLAETQLLMNEAENRQIPYAAWSFHQQCPPNLIADINTMTPTDWGRQIMNQLQSPGAPQISDVMITPSVVFTEMDAGITISASISDAQGTVSSVAVNLSSIGGNAVTNMSNTGGDIYSAAYTVPAGQSQGNHLLTISATDDDSNVRTHDVSLAVTSIPTTDLNIYYGGETLIEGTWASSNGVLTESSNGAEAHEGTESYRFDYNFNGWWAGFGLEFNAWNEGDGTGIDIAGYASLQIAYHLTGPTVVNIVLVDADGTSETVEVELGDANASYEVVTIPLTEFSGMPLNDVADMNINISGVQVASGTLWIDGIRVLAP